MPGIPVTAEDCDIVTIEGAFKLLTSPDPAIRALATEDLNTTVRDRTGRPPPRTADLEDYLSASQEGSLQTTTNWYTNAWTRARTASRHLNCRWGLDPGIQITIDGKTTHAQHRQLICHNLRTITRENRTATLQTAPHQGKVEVVSMSRASRHFHTTGSFTRFADWRFIHRARLGLVPLGAYSFNDSTTLCRRCNSLPETLPHVLNHCPVHNRAILARHNNIVERIKTAALPKMRLIAEDREILEGVHIRSDLLLVHQRSAYIIDVTSLRK